MTICIAAICDSGRSMVCAADRLFVHYELELQFEPPERKIEQLYHNCAALASSNNSSISTEILEAARRGSHGADKVSIEALAHLVQQSFARVRLRSVEESIILPRLGPDYAKHRDLGARLPDYLSQQRPTYERLLSQMEHYVLDAYFLIAGVDQSGAHLYQINNPGVVHCLDKLGYMSIGTGASHAVVWLSRIGQTRQSNLFTTLCQVHRAKKMAEVSPGVGRTTDLAVIDQEMGLWYCTGPILAELNNIEQSRRGREEPALESLMAVYREERGLTDEK